MKEMVHEWPMVTVIVPTRPGQETVPAVAACRKLDYPADKLEIIVARGRQPAVQRNQAVAQAKGEWIYFLDDDAQPLPGSLRRAIELGQDAKVAMVGGPNLCPPDAPALEQVFAVALSSWLGFGPSRARYDAVGQTRESSEKELILCNLLARRQAFLDAGGFDESLYPNEENALMDALTAQKLRLLYDPDMTVHRRPRPTLGAFFRMLMTYGRGRAEQFRLHPTPGSILNFVPPAFVAYLLVGPWFGWLGLIPLGCYLVAVLAQTLLSMASGKGFLRSILALPLVVATHVFYGLGFWKGLFTRIRTDAREVAAEVNLETIAVEGGSHGQS